MNVDSLQSKVWGLTGNIASGKTTFGKYLSQLGAVVIDADEIARNLRAPGGPLSEKIQKTFGTQDPGELRKMIFKSEEKKKALEAILHPAIVEKSRTAFQKAFEQDPRATVVYEAALLVETQRYKNMAGLIMVTAPHSVRKERLTARDHIDDQTADAVLAGQMPEKEKILAASIVVDNSGDLVSLELQAKKVFAQIQAA